MPTLYPASVPHFSLSHIDHRPWPLPAGAWTWRQSWVDLCFLHWPVPASLLRPLVPAGLTVQECEGTSWIGIVPFRMEGVMRRPFPDIPSLSAFPELNVRLYVEADGKPGVWFLSLDATQPIAVWAARKFFHLPYFRARISCPWARGEVDYRKERVDGRASFAARYRPTGEQYQSARGTLDHFLTERYCLYALSPTGQLLRNEVHHVPWPLYRAEAAIERNTMVVPHGLELPDVAPLVHFAPRVDVVVWSSERVGR